MRAVDALEVLELVGSGQWGLVASAQAKEAGVSPLRLARLAEQGTIRRLRHGVYALPSADSGPLQELRAAWLATGSQPIGQHPIAVVSGESAAAVHQLGDLLPSIYEFATAVRRQTTQPDIRYRKRTLSSDQVTRVDGLPVTTVARTVGDLAAGGTDFDHLAGVVRDALLDRDTTSGRLAESLDPSADRFGFDGGEAFLAALLKRSGFKPDEALVRVMRHGAEQSALDLVTPELRNAVNQMVRTELRQVLPSMNLTPFTAQLSESLRPNFADFNRAFFKQSPLLVADMLKLPGRNATLPAKQAEEKESRNASDDDRGGGSTPEEVPRRQIGRRSSKTRRSG